MSKWIVDIHGDIEGDYEIIEEYKEPKTGHWIEGNYHIRCSECGEDYTYSLRNYCPNCGAKMQEVEE